VLLWEALNCFRAVCLSLSLSVCEKTVKLLNKNWCNLVNHWKWLCLWLCVSYVIDHLKIGIERKGILHLLPAVCRISEANCGWWAQLWGDSSGVQWLQFSKAWRWSGTIWTWTDAEAIWRCFVCSASRRVEHSCLDGFGRAHYQACEIIPYSRFFVLLLQNIMSVDIVIRFSIMSVSCGTVVQFIVLD